MDSAEIINQHVKIWFLVIMTLYAVFGYWWSSKFAGATAEDVGLNYLLIVVVGRASSLAWLIFFPLIFLPLGATAFTLGQMFGYVVSFYSVILVLLFIYVLLFGLGSLLDLVGFGGYKNILSQSNFQKAFKDMRMRKR